MTEKLLLELILALLVGICSILWWMLVRHDRLHDALDGKLDDLSQMRVSCGNAFATKDSMRRAHHRVDELETKHEDLSTRVTRLESCERGKS